MLPAQGSFRAPLPDPVKPPEVVVSRPVLLRPIVAGGRERLSDTQSMIRRPKSGVGGIWAERLMPSVRESRSRFWPFGSASTGNAAFATVQCSIFAPRGGDIVGERRSRCSHLTGIFVAPAARLLMAANEARILPPEQKHP